MLFQLAVSHLALPIHFIRLPDKLIYLNYLLFFKLLLDFGFLLMCKDVRGTSDVGQVTLSFICIVLQLDLRLQLHLVEQLLPNERFLRLNPRLLLLPLLLGLLRAEVRLVVLSVDLPLHALAVAVRLHLLRQVAQVLEVVFAPQLLVVRCDHIGLVLLPTELLALVLPIVLDALTLVLEASVRLHVGSGKVCNELLALVAGVVIYLERALGAHEVRVGGRVVRWTYLLPVEGQAYDGADVILRILFTCLGSRSVTAARFEQTASGAVKPVHILK